jgi:hypothetical protein
MVRRSAALRARCHGLAGVNQDRVRYLTALNDALLVAEFWTIQLRHDQPVAPYPLVWAM